MDFCSLESRLFSPLMASASSTISQAAENLPSAPTLFQKARSKDQSMSVALMSLATRTGAGLFSDISSAFLAP